MAAELIKSWIVHDLGEAKNQKKIFTFSIFDNFEVVFEEWKVKTSIHLSDQGSTDQNRLVPGSPWIRGMDVILAWIGFNQSVNRFE